MRVALKQIEVRIVRDSQPFIMSLSVLREDLLRLGQVAEINTLLLSGIEPLLHPDIDEIIATCRSTNIVKMVTVVTTGQLLHRMSDRFWRIIHGLELDVYPGQLSGAGIVYVQNKAREHHIDLKIVIGKRDKTIQCVYFDYGYVHITPRCKEADGLSLDGITTEKLKAFLERMNDD